MTKKQKKQDKQAKADTVEARAAKASAPAADARVSSLESLSREDYEAQLHMLQVELVKLQRHFIRCQDRILVVLEGRDAAGKDGSIKRIVEYLSPRETRVVALGKPSDRERSGWYFQRYVPHLPVAEELVLFNRSWYNRAGVEHVMGFCSPAQYREFLVACPRFEQMLVDDGILLLKYWLAVDQAQQEERFAERASDPLKRWKISPVDLKARERYAAYGQARDAMIAATHQPSAPWFVADFNDQRRGRLDLIAHLLRQLPERLPADKPLRLPRLRTAPAREELADPGRWIKPPR